MPGSEPKLLVAQQAALVYLFQNSTEQNLLEELANIV
jgi:hypothetical protein